MVKKKIVSVFCGKCRHVLSFCCCGRERWLVPINFCAVPSVKKVMPKSKTEMPSLICGYCGFKKCKCSYDDNGMLRGE